MWALPTAQKHTNTRKIIFSLYPNAGMVASQNSAEAMPTSKKPSQSCVMCLLGQWAPGSPGTAYTPHNHLCTSTQHSTCETSQAMLQTALHLPTSFQLALGAPASPVPGPSWLGGGTFLPPSQGQIPAPLTRLRDPGHQATANCSDDSGVARGTQIVLAHCGCRAVPKEHQPWLPALVQHQAAKAESPPALVPRGYPGQVGAVDRAQTDPFPLLQQTAWEGLRVLCQQSLGTPTAASLEPSACAPWSPSATCTGPRAGTRAQRVRALQGGLC